MTQPTLFGDAVGARELLPFDGSAVLHSVAIDSATAERLMGRLHAEVGWEQHRVWIFGREVPQPRLVAWFGDPGSAYTYSGLTLQPSPWPDVLTEAREISEHLAGVPFNSVLANLYRDGRDSVSWHADDEPELGSDPVIASVSLGAERRFDLRHRATGETVKAVLPQGSVVVMAKGCQRHWVHQVPKMLRVKTPRINLTFRRFM